MTTLLHNDLLVRQIGWTLLHTLWQGVSIALLLAIALRAMRDASSSARYIIACGAMTMFVSVAILTFALLAQPPVAATPRVVRLPAPEVSVAPTSKIIPSSAFAAAQTEIDPLRTIVTIWMTGVIAIAIWHVGGWLLLVRLRCGQPVAHLGDVLDRLAEKIGVRRAVRVLEAARIDVPAVLGVLRPVILVPLALLNDLSPQQVEAILAHELAHIRRHDFLVNLIQSVIETLMFYHPATWWMSSVVRRERENCCDDIAAQVCRDERVYAAALAALEQRRLSAASLHLAPSATGGDLLDRVRRVLKLPPLRRRISRVRSLAAAALALACVVLPLVVTATDEKPATTQAASAKYRAVKVVVAKDELQYEGKFIDIAALKTLLSAMPEAERQRTVLEVAAAAPDVTVERFFTATAALHRIVSEQKLAYLSQTGIQSQPAPATTRAASAPANATGNEFYMSGLIQRAGVYALPPQRITLKQAIVAAGGPTREPAGLLVTVVRREGDADRYVMQNVSLADVLSGKVDLATQGNDVVRVTDKPVDVKAAAAANVSIIPADPNAKQVGEYYIEGIVQRTGVYSLTARKITLKQAIAAAGGFDDGKEDALLTIVRRSGANRDSKPVENVRYSEIVSGVTRDAYLQPNDVIQVRDVPASAPPSAPASAPAAATQPHADAVGGRASMKRARLDLLQLVYQRDSQLMQLETLETRLGRDHPTIKAARAALEQLDRRIKETEAAAAKTSVEEIGAGDPTMREYLKQLEAMEFNLERLKRSMGPKSRVYLDAERDIELQKQRINTYAATYRRQFEPDAMLDTRHQLIPLEPSTGAATPR